MLLAWEDRKPARRRSAFGNSFSLLLRRAKMARQARRMAQGTKSDGFFVLLRRSQPPAHRSYGPVGNS